MSASMRHGLWCRPVSSLVPLTAKCAKQQKAILFSSTSRIRRVFDAFERMNVALVVGLENHESVESKKKR